MLLRNPGFLLEQLGYDMITSAVQNDSLLELSGTLAFGDLVRFHYAQCYRTWWMILPVMLVSAVGVLLAVVVALLTSDLELARHAGTPFLLLLIFVTALATTPYRGAKRLMKTSPHFSAPITYIFTPRGIHSSGLHFSGDVSYEALWTVRETKSLFLLYLNAGSAFVLPKRFFKDSVQQNDWRLVLDQRISPNSIVKPGFLGRWL